jgi:uncharacterized protein
MTIQPFSGFGVCLRREHYADFAAGNADVDFVEIISENYLIDGGRPLAVLDEVRSHYHVAMHGVSLSIGSADGIDRDYLTRLKQLAARIEPLWVSDHLCWTRTSAHNSHDLLPMPLTAAALDVVCANLNQVQDLMGRALLLENPSSYCQFPEDEMPEWEFLSAIVQRTGCGLLLDVNNVYVSAANHGFSAHAYFAGLPLDAVRQIHLAGHTPGDIIIDTHDRPVCDDVWALYRAVIGDLGPVATMVEWDAEVPLLPTLLAEVDIARRFAAEGLAPELAA